jgi:dihydrofolate synthase/folylpolyglutamate synthase
MTDALLRARGLRTGRFTSPHLVSIRERIVIDGAPISPERFVAAYDEIIPYVNLVDERHPAAMSFFEVLTGMAFAVFADTPVDVMVLEVGVGGRLDCTNVADGVVAVVTPISIDHTRLLGSTVEEIAAEKAGIIKPGAVAVLAQQPLGAAEVLLRYAVEVGATVAREGVEFGVLSREQAVGGQQLVLRGLRGTYEDVYLPLFGLHQAANAACALAAVEAFAGVGDDAGAALDADLVRESFAKVSSPGRLEVVRRSPTIIIDAAHNPAGMAASVAAIEEAFTFGRLSGVFAASGDKDVPGMLAELEPLLTDIVVTRNSSDRSLDPEQTAELAVEIFGEDRVQSADRLDDAIETAVALADEAVAETGPGSGGVLITGSVITAGDARRLLAPAGGELPAEPPASQPSRHSFTAAELS